LLDSSREYRRGKKRKAGAGRRVEGSVPLVPAGEGDEDEDSDSGEIRVKEEAEDGNEMDIEDDELGPHHNFGDESTKKSKKISKQRPKSTRKKTKHLRRDMYKIFDGSALMLLGRQTLPLLLRYFIPSFF
jgi:hypothetical protein